MQWEAPGAADYVTDPLNPTGFWPEFLDQVVAKINEHYTLDLQIQRASTRALSSLSRVLPQLYLRL